MSGHAIIAGAGIGGLAAALALKKVGWTCRVLERSSELREVGAGISLWANGLAALRELGLDTEVERCGHPFEVAVTRNWRGRELSRTPVGRLHDRLGIPSLALHRADLQACLLRALPPEWLWTGAEVSQFEADPQGVTVHAGDGRVARGDVLIGADGLHSRVRAQLHGPERLRYAGYTCWRAVTKLPEGLLRPGQTEVTLGPGSHGGLVDLGGGRTYWFLTENGPAGRTRAAHLPHLQTRFADWCRPWPQVFAATREENLVPGDIFDRPPLAQWGHGRVTLLGDAAHPTTPNLGQGACQALESAIWLACSLACQRDPERALRHYERTRQRRSASITRRSWQTGRLFQVDSPWLALLRDGLLGLLGPTSLPLGSLEDLIAWQLPALRSGPAPG